MTTPAQSPSAGKLIKFQYKLRRHYLRECRFLDKYDTTRELPKPSGQQQVEGTIELQRLSTLAVCVTYGFKSLGDLGYDAEIRYAAEFELNPDTPADTIDPAFREITARVAPNLLHAFVYQLFSDLVGRSRAEAIKLPATPPIIVKVQDVAVPAPEAPSSGAA